MRSHKNLTPTAAGQMNFDGRARKFLGNRARNSKAHERYDRCVCANELLLRDTISKRMVNGWSMDAAFRLPETVATSESAGKEEIPLTTAAPSGPVAT